MSLVLRKNLPTKPCIRLIFLQDCRWDITWNFLIFFFISLEKSSSKISFETKLEKKMFSSKHIVHLGDGIDKLIVVHLWVIDANMLYCWFWLSSTTEPPVQYLVLRLGILWSILPVASTDYQNKVWKQLLSMNEVPTMVQGNLRSKRYDEKSSLLELVLTVICC